MARRKVSAAGSLGSTGIPSSGGWVQAKATWGASPSRVVGKEKGPEHPVWMRRALGMVVIRSLDLVFQSGASCRKLSVFQPIVDAKSARRLD